MELYAIYDSVSGVISRYLHLSEVDAKINLKTNEMHLLVTDALKEVYVSNGEIVAYNAEEIQIKNNLPPGFIWQMPERIAVDIRVIEDAQKQAWAKIKLARATAIAAPVEYNSNTYDMNTVSITSAVQMATLNSAYITTWTTATNTDVLLTAQEIIELGTAMHTQLNAAHDHARTLRKQIYQPNQTVAQIDAISW